jgi:hypothetical protein
MRLMKKMKIWSVLGSVAMVAALHVGAAASSAESIVLWPDPAGFSAPNAVGMKFDLSRIPAGAIVQLATLNLDLARSDGGGDHYAVSSHKVLGIDAASTPTLSQPYDTQSIDDTPGFRAWTITGMVQEWMTTPAENLGLVVSADPRQAPNRYRHFASIESTDASRRPFLKVTYITPDAAIAPIARTGATSAASTRPGQASTAPWLPGAASSTSASVMSATAPAGAASGDGESPNVSIAGPSPRTPVTGTVTLKANASDNVGVTSVQFKLDGAEIGTAGSAPYNASWDSSTASNGFHTLTAVARDAAGNTRESAGVKINLSNATHNPATQPAGGGNTGGNGGGGNGGGNGGGSGGGNVLFDSAWDTATGTSTAAVTDGGRWPNYWEFNHGNGTQLLSVVPDGPKGHNALRVQQRGSGYAANVQIDNVLPQSKDYYIRFYMRNDDTSGSGDHIVTVDTWKYANLTFMRKMGNASGWNFVASLYGCGYTYPIGHWGPTKALALGQWYRFEYFVHFVDATHIQLHPRVYDAQGNLMFSDAEFMQTNPGQASFNGRSDWSLASFYAAGNSFCLDPSASNDIGLGNNGQTGSEDNSKYWYFSGIQVRTDGWPGPIGDKGSKATAGAENSLPSADVEGVREQPQQPGTPENVPNQPLGGLRGGKTVPSAESVPQADHAVGPVVAGQDLLNSDVAKPAAPKQPSVSPRTVNPGTVRDPAPPAANPVGKPPR